MAYNIDMKSILYVFDYLTLQKVVDNYPYRTRLIGNSNIFRDNIKTALKIKMRVIYFANNKCNYNINN